jgi:tetratricopeptide (TPR) repeat protein
MWLIVGDSLRMKAYFAGCRGDSEGLVSLHADSVRVVDQLRRPTTRWINRNDLAAIAAFQGEFDRAEQLALEAAELGRLAERSDDQILSALGGVLYQVRMAQGRIDELVPLLEGRVERSPDVPVWRVALAGALTESGRHDAALVHHLWLAENGCARVPRDVEFGVTMCGLGRQAYYLRPPEPIMRDIYERLLPWAGLFNWSGPTITDPNDLGIAMTASALGMHDDADRHFADAVALCESAGARGYQARAHMGWATALNDRGETAPAREQARAALEIGEAIGMTGPHGVVVHATALLE